MNNNFSPKYLMELINRIETTLWEMFEKNKYKNVLYYIEKWHTIWYDNNEEENFSIEQDERGNIDLLKTLHNIEGETLLKIAIDIGIETPDFIPSIPTFRNELKSDYKTASATFEKAFRQIEEHPDIAVGLANSALESIIKEILNDKRITTKAIAKKTLYELTIDLLKEFHLFPNKDMPAEIKTIGSSLLSICQSIEKLRSEKTNIHGKTQEDYIINDSIYTCFIINTISTIGLFLNSFYKKKFPQEERISYPEPDDIPF